MLLISEPHIQFLLGYLWSLVMLVELFRIKLWERWSCKTNDKMARKYLMQLINQFCVIKTASSTDFDAIDKCYTRPGYNNWMALGIYPVKTGHISSLIISIPPKIELDTFDLVSLDNIFNYRGFPYLSVVEPTSRFDKSRMNRWKAIPRY